MPSAAPPRVFLLDGNSYIFRAFFATKNGDRQLFESDRSYPVACLPKSSLSPAPTHAIYGFTNMILGFVQRYQPEYFAVVLDSPGETFRRQMFLDYKRNRLGAPADLKAQLPYIRQVLKALNVSVVELEGYEADDLIATVCKSLSGGACECVIVSSDKDLMQLITDRVKFLDTAKKRWITAEDVKTKFGVEPERVVEVMALMGDAVDNIPGVKGIGEKTAIALIRRFGTLDNLFANLDQIEATGMRGAARTRKVLENGKNAAFLSRELATLMADLPIRMELEDLRFLRPEIRRLLALFSDLERVPSGGRHDCVDCN
ncbi:MAG: 5'-3' exonuclease [Candidatus Binatia bacterium]